MCKTQRRHLGFCHKFMRSHCFCLLRINSLEERTGPCPNMNPKGHPETSTPCDKGLEPQKTPKMQSQCEHYKLLHKHWSLFVSPGCQHSPHQPKVLFVPFWPTQGVDLSLLSLPSIFLGHPAWPALSPPKQIQQADKRESYPHKLCCCELMDECEITSTLAVGSFWNIKSVVLPYKTWHEILASNINKCQLKAR